MKAYHMPHHKVNHNKFQRIDRINTTLSSCSAIKAEIINSLKIGGKMIGI